MRPWLRQRLRRGEALLLAAAAALTLLPGPASAKPPAEPGFASGSPPQDVNPGDRLAAAQASCGPGLLPFDGARTYLAEEHGETPVFTGLSEKGWVAVVFLNPESGSWSVLLLRPDGCAAPADQGQNGRASAPTYPETRLGGAPASLTLRRGGSGGAGPSPRRSGFGRAGGG